jgi:hypothetical protein
MDLSRVSWFFLLDLVSLFLAGRKKKAWRINCSSSVRAGIVVWHPTGTN